MQNPNQHPHHGNEASLTQEFRQKLRQWQDDNRDWEDYANIHPSQIRDDRIRRRRQQICEGIAALTLGGIQRRANESRLPAHMGHGEKFLRSEAMTVAQHAHGIRIPLDHQLGELYGFIDHRLLGHLATDVIATIQDWVRAKIQEQRKHY